MFIEYIDFIFVPFRTVWNKWMKVRNVKGNFGAEMARVKSLGNQGKQKFKEGQKNLAAYQQKFGPQGALPPGQQPQPGQPPQAQGGYPPQGYPPQGYPPQQQP